MKITTGWSPSGYREYAHRFAATFERYWPAGIGYSAWVEEFSGAPRATERRLFEIPGVLEFFERHAGDRAARGREVSAAWKPGDRRIGYNWRLDAMKFCRQVFIIAEAGREAEEGELLLWLDADVVTHAPCSPEAIGALLPDGFDLAYLGREPKHSEIGFQLYRVNERTRRMLTYFRELYAGDRIFSEKEWHSAYAFDLARRWAESHVGLKSWNLTPGGRGHVWHQSPLTQWLDHLKGDRKQAGRSPERK